MRRVRSMDLYVWAIWRRLFLFVYFGIRLAIMGSVVTRLAWLCVYRGTCNDGEGVLVVLRLM